MSTPRQVTVLFFAGVRDAAGTAREELVLAPDVTRIAHLAALLERSYAGLAGRLAGVRYAINEEFVEMDAPLGSGDVVAVIPPVSGG
jgi:molybdopterin converting factor subunit 1